MKQITIFLEGESPTINLANSINITISAQNGKFYDIVQKNEGNSTRGELFE